jgi:hypothetical protein
VSPVNAKIQAATGLNCNLKPTIATAGVFVVILLGDFGL